MKPKKSPVHERQGNLFRVELARIIDRGHGLVKLAEAVDWHRLDEMFGSTYCPDNGRPGVSTRLMVALHYLKYTHNLSDEEVVACWVENPYWQYFSGMKWFEHEVPIDPSSMTRWRKRIGEAGAEGLLRETLEAGLKIKAVKPHQLKRVNVDTTVQEKEIRFPTDARLYDRARQRLAEAAKDRGISLRQNYNRKSKHALYMQSRYAHAQQMQRARQCTRKLKTYLGRVIRDIERNYQKPDEPLRNLLEIGRKIFHQQRTDKNKTYSVHAPEVECISKGKAHKRYEFGCKVSVAATSRGGWFVGAQAVHGNPYDGHTLSDALSQVERMGIRPEQAFVDMGYRGHNYEGPVEVHVDKRHRGRTAKSLWRWMKRRAAIEPGIGHLKREHRMDRNRLKGKEGDCINAILSAAGMNFSKLLRWAGDLLRLFFLWIFSLCKPQLYLSRASI
ncbi:MAG TPA: IS5 family transposase [Candidatus Cloacimonadota bacterium]|jgi:IS5 family transposase|nr:IS5 family transposase [Candidatus Cloacimonadota bacterium]